MNLMLNEPLKCHAIGRLAWAAATVLLGCGSDPNDPAAPQLRQGDITTWVGDGTQGNDGDGHALLESWLNQPMALQFAADGSGLILDWNNHCVRRSTRAGTLETVIGLDLPGDWPCQSPEDPSSCEVPLDGAINGRALNLNHPTGVALAGSDGSFYVAAWHNHKLLHFDAGSREVTIVAGRQKPGFAGDGGPARQALLNFPSAVVLQSDGGLLVSDERNNRVRRIAPDADHIITTVAGADPAISVDADGAPATQTRLDLTTSEEASGSDNPPPGGSIILGSDGSLLIADTFHHCIRRVAPGADGVVGVGDPSEEVVSTLAGTCGAAGYDGDGGPATAALLDRPFGLALGPDGALYIADTHNHAIRRVDQETGSIETLIGTGSPGFAGDGDRASTARLREPYGVAFDGEGNLYVVDTQNNRIRRVVR